jgi:hypothetical protein
MMATGFDMDMSEPQPSLFRRFQSFPANWPAFTVRAPNPCSKWMPSFSQRAA